MALGIAKDPKWNWVNLRKILWKTFNNSQKETLLRHENIWARTLHHQINSLASWNYWKHWRTWKTFKG